ncbi:hypothetical protein GCM10020000_86150 [Streptomyces olivoverticillatus]
MSHLAHTGQPLYLSQGDLVRIMMVPRLVEDASLASLPWERDLALGRWEIAFELANHDMLPFTVCLMEARSLTSVAMADDGHLFERLHPAARGSAVDAHMAVVLLALAMYTAARSAGVLAVGDLPVQTVADLLGPDRAPELKTVRPRFRPQAPVSHLRAADVARLTGADRPQWQTWRKAAADVVAFVAEDVLRELRRSPREGAVRFLHYLKHTWETDAQTWSTAPASEQPA